MNPHQLLNETALQAAWRIVGQAGVYGDIEHDRKVVSAYLREAGFALPTPSQSHRTEARVVRQALGQDSVEHELRQVLAELELVSHVAAVNLEPSSRDASESIGGRRPPGGVDRREDRHKSDPREKPGRRDEPERVLRSAQHFREELARGKKRPARLLEEAKASLAAWKRQSPPKHPLMGDPGWKRWVAESPESHADLARKCGCTRQNIREVRLKWGTIPPAQRKPSTVTPMGLPRDSDVAA
jgi:hypothetical protein